MKTKLVMEAGDSNWWNYIIEYEIERVYHGVTPCGEAWDVDICEPHTVFRENRHGIAKCVGKKLIYDSVKNGVRLVDSKYECKEDDGEDDYNGENI